MGNEKLTLKRAVIVEGKYDKIKLESLVDGLILETRGFRVFKDKETQRLIRTLAMTCGIVILTDSDAAGFKIRSLISGIINESGADVVNAYIPDIRGKERRKTMASAEGKLGVEGMEREVLREALMKAGALSEGGKPEEEVITRLDFYNDGFCGGQNSAALRRGLFERLGLPARLSTNAALKLLNRMLTREEYEKLRDEVRQ